MKIRIKRVPSTTNNITTGVINFLNSRGHCAFDVYSGGIFDPFLGTWRKRRRASVGVNDVVACMRRVHVGRHAYEGLFFGFEIKNESTKDKQRIDQESFMQRVIKAGGHYVIVTSYKAFIEWYEQSEFE